jgi:hypothetical protein
MISCSFSFSAFCDLVRLVDSSGNNEDGPAATPGLTTVDATDDEKYSRSNGKDLY